MMSAEPVDVLEALSALEVHDLPAGARERVRTWAGALLGSRRRSAGWGGAGLRAIYDRVIEPALLTALVATQLAWAAHRTLLLL